MSLRTATIRLAYENPSLRPVLLPLLVKHATYQEYVESKKQEGEKPKLDKDEWEARYGQGGGGSKSENTKKIQTVRDAQKEGKRLLDKVYDDVARLIDPKARPGSGVPVKLKKDPIFKKVFDLVDEAYEGAELVEDMTRTFKTTKGGKSIGEHAAASLKKYREAEKELEAAAKKWKAQQK